MLFFWSEDQVKAWCEARRVRRAERSSNSVACGWIMEVCSCGIFPKGFAHGRQRDTHPLAS